MSTNIPKKKKKIQCVFNFEHGTPNVSGGNPQTRSASETSATEHSGYGIMYLCNITDHEKLVHTIL
jgi:hypothetical protein